MENIFSAPIGGSYIYFNLQGKKSANIRLSKIAGELQNKLSSHNNPSFVYNSGEQDIFAIATLYEAKIGDRTGIIFYHFLVFNGELNNHYAYDFIASIYNQEFGGIQDFLRDAFDKKYSLEQYISKLRSVVQKIEKDIRLFKGVKYAMKTGGDIYHTASSEYLPSEEKSFKGGLNSSDNMKFGKIKLIAISSIISGLIVFILYNLFTSYLPLSNRGEMLQVVQGIPQINTKFNNETRDTIIVIAYPSGGYRIISISQDQKVSELYSAGLD